MDQTLSSSGGILRTIYPWDAYFEAASANILPPHALYAGSPRQRQRVRGLPSSDCTHVLVDWRIVVDGRGGAQGARDVVILEIGRDGQTRLNLTDATRRVHRDQDVSFGDDFNARTDTDDGVLIVSARQDENSGNEQNHDELIYISDQVKVKVNTGGADHIINLPWFHLPDAALFHNQMHGYDYDVDLRVVARYSKSEQKTSVQIWKSAPLTEWLRLRKELAKRQSLHMKPDKSDPIENDNISKDFINAEGKLTNILRGNSSYTSGILATIHGVDSVLSSVSSSSSSSKFSIKTTIHNAELPSRTYWIRTLILAPLAPSLMIAFFLLTGSLQFLPILLLSSKVLAVLALYCAAVIICWIFYRVRRRRTTTTRGIDGFGLNEGSSGKTMDFVEWTSTFWLTKPVYSCLAQFCCCFCCGSSRSKRRRGAGRYGADEKKMRRKNMVIWGPTGPVYEE